MQYVLCWVAPIRCDDVTLGYGLSHNGPSMDRNEICEPRVKSGGVVRRGQDRLRKLHRKTRRMMLCNVKKNLARGPLTQLHVVYLVRRRIRRRKIAAEAKSFAGSNAYAIPSMVGMSYIARHIAIASRKPPPSTMALGINVPL